jgi:TolB-like protein
VLGAVGIMLYRNQAGRPSNQPQPSALHSVAVLPLKNLSGDPDSEYFADGLTETFITELSRVRGLKVISRGSAFTFKDKDIDPREAGRQLGVAAVLEGSVRRSGDRMRVDVRLVSTQSGEVLWVGDAYERSIGDIQQPGTAGGIRAPVTGASAGNPFGRVGCGKQFAPHAEHVQVYYASSDRRQTVAGRHERLRSRREPRLFQHHANPSAEGP